MTTLPMPSCLVEIRQNKRRQCTAVANPVIVKISVSNLVCNGVVGNVRKLPANSVAFSWLVSIASLVLTMYQEVEVGQDSHRFHQVKIYSRIFSCNILIPEAAR